MSEFKININVPFPSKREAEVAYQVLRVDKEPQRGGVTKFLSQEDNLLKAEFRGNDPRKVRVGLTNFYDSLVLVTETMSQFGPPQPAYNHY